MSIKEILDRIANESGTNKKMEILSEYTDNDLLKSILYQGISKRVKFYIKDLPIAYSETSNFNLFDGLELCDHLSSRKLRGGDAKAAIIKILSNLSPDDGDVLRRVLTKDMKIGMGRTNINKVFGKGFLEKTPYMGAKSFSIDLINKLIKSSNGEAMASDVKMDGRYMNAIIRGGEVEGESRQGEPTILGGATFLDELKGLDDCVLNGELTLDGVSRYESNGIISSMIDITKKREERGLAKTEKKIETFEKKHGSFNELLGKIRYTVWDTITIDEYYDNKSNTPYFIRHNNLLELVEGLTMVSVVESKLVYTFDDIMNHFQEMINRGEEGTVLKSLIGTWKDGKPNFQIKLKLELELDLKITGFNYGTGKNSDVISSLNCETSDGKLKTRPTGMNEEMMLDITERQDELLDTVVVVKCSGISQDSKGEYSLLHPVFKGLRIGEKDIADSLEDVKNIELITKGLK